MAKKVIIAFCRTNLSLHSAVQHLYDTALAFERSHPARVVVRPIRCLTKCHTCATTPYVKVGNEILEAPSQPEFQARMMFELAGLETGSEPKRSES
jgi:hypothetical protein